MSPRFDQSIFMRKAKEGVQKELASPDHIIVQTVAAIDELNKITNLMFERLNEWYGLHFPEFKHKDPIKYAKVARVLDRANPDKIELERLLPDTYSALLQKANNSVGVHFGEHDMQMLRAHADALLNLYNLKENLEKYEEEIAKQFCPNITELAGPKIASQLVAHAGSLKKLAAMPSSTIQVIGAEKSLFKHLKTGSPPPKHGLIFQHPKISMSPKHARGKIARALAAKITIATKADAISHHDISAKLKEQFEKRAEDVLQKARANPPKASSKSDSYERPRRDFAAKRNDDSDERPKRFGSDRPHGGFGRRDNDRPRGGFGDRRRDNSDRPRGGFGRPRSGGFRRSDDSDRPRRSFGGDSDRPRRSFGGDSDRPRRSFGGDSDRPRRSFGTDSDRPRRSFGGDRPSGRSDDSRPRTGGFGGERRRDSDRGSGGKKFYSSVKKRSNRPRR